RPAAVCGLVAHHAVGSRHHRVWLAGMEPGDRRSAGARLRRRQPHRARPARRLARGRLPRSPRRPRGGPRGGRKEHAIGRCGGRLARRAAQTGGAALAVGVDSLAVQLPGDVWVLERPTELTVTDSAATVTGLVLQSAYRSGKLVLEGALPTRGRADAHLQLEG